MIVKNRFISRVVIIFFMAISQSYTSENRELGTNPLMDHHRDSQQHDSPLSGGAWRFSFTGVPVLPSPQGSCSLSRGHYSPECDMLEQPNVECLQDGSSAGHSRESRQLSHVEQAVVLQSVADKKRINESLVSEDIFPGLHTVPSEQLESEHRKESDQRGGIERETPKSQDINPSLIAMQSFSRLEDEKKKEFRLCCCGSADDVATK